jgi:hypothetical protein
MLFAFAEPGCEAFHLGTVMNVYDGIAFRCSLGFYSDALNREWRQPVKVTAIAGRGFNANSGERVLNPTLLAIWQSRSNRSATDWRRR